MLRDVVNNQLAIIRLSFDLPYEKNEAGAAALGRVQDAIDKISPTLMDVSEKSLARGRTRYDFAPPPFAK
jgi:hypothetical protein